MVQSYVIIHGHQGTYNTGSEIRGGGQGRDRLFALYCIFIKQFLFLLDFFANLCPCMSDHCPLRETYLTYYYDVT